MNPELMKMVGRLGQGPRAGWIWSWLAFQVIGSLLLVILDAGFPAWIIIGGWLLFLGLVGAMALSGHRRERLEQEWNRRLWREQRLRIERLRLALKEDPSHETPCDICLHFDPKVRACLLGTPPEERRFRLRHSDSQTYCLNWQQGRENTAGTGRPGPDSRSGAKTAT